MSSRVPSRGPWLLATLVVLALGWLSWNSSGFAQIAGTPLGQESGASSLELIPGVVIDRARNVVFIMDPEGTVGAVSLRSGARLWTSEVAAKPLAVHGGLLIAQAESTRDLEIAVLDPGRSGERVRTLRISLPDGLVPNIDETASHVFEARGFSRSGAPLISWSSRSRQITGIVPQDGRPRIQDRSQAYSLELSSGRVQAVDASRIGSNVPALPATVRDWSASQGSPTEIRRADGVLAATEVARNSQDLVLKRWNAVTGVALDDIVVSSDPHAVRIASSDSRHLLVSERAFPGEEEEYEWSIFSTATGQRIVRMRQRRSHAPFWVEGEILLHEVRPVGRRVGDQWRFEPRRLRAVSMGSGVTLWEWPLRDTAFAGETPP